MFDNTPAVSKTSKEIKSDSKNNHCFMFSLNQCFSTGGSRPKKPKVGRGHLILGRQNLRCGTVIVV